MSEEKAEVQCEACGCVIECDCGCLDCEQGESDSDDYDFIDETGYNGEEL